MRVTLLTAARAEAEIRIAGGGVMPATMAVLGGRIHIGLTEAELDTLGRFTDVTQLSRADLVVCVGPGRHCRDDDLRASHRDHHFRNGRHRQCASRRRDQFQYLCRSPGNRPVPGGGGGGRLKSNLHLPKTLEYPETSSAPVIAFGQDDLTAFWSRDPGLKARLCMDDPVQVAAAAASRWSTRFRRNIRPR